MKNKIFLVTAIFSMFICGVVGASSINGEYKGNPIVKVLVNGHPITSEVPAQIIDGSTLLPLRAISESLGAVVQWNPENYSVSIVKNEISFNHIDGEPLYFVSDGPLHFLYKNVDMYSVLLTNRDKSYIYQKDVDYKLENNTILRLSSGHIKQLESVLMSYSYVVTPELNYNMKSIPKTLEKLKNHQPVNIVFLGDSTTEQNAFTQGFDNHVKQVEIELKKRYPNTEINVFNKGISSQTSGDGLKRFQKDVLDLNPDLMIICFGLNEVYKNVSKSIFESDMETMIKSLSIQGKEVIVRTPNPAVFHNGTNADDLRYYNEVTKKLAIKYNMAFCDTFSKFEDIYKQGLTAFPDLTSDELHPNARAQSLITNELMKFFN